MPCFVFVVLTCLAKLAKMYWQYESLCLCLCLCVYLCQSCQLALCSTDASRQCKSDGRSSELITKAFLQSFSNRHFTKPVPHLWLMTSDTWSNWLFDFTFPKKIQNVFSNTFYQTFGTYKNQFLYNVCSNLFCPPGPSHPYHSCCSKANTWKTNSLVVYFL